MGCLIWPMGIGIFTLVTSIAFYFMGSPNQLSEMWLVSLIWIFIPLAIIIVKGFYDAKSKARLDAANQKAAESKMKEDKIKQMEQYEANRRMIELKDIEDRCRKYKEQVYSIMRKKDTLSLLVPATIRCIKDINNLQQFQI